MSAGIFKQQVNFVISVVFLCAFGAFLTSMVLRASRLGDPITGSAVAADEYYYAAISD